jgi:hypothetical protein
MSLECKSRQGCDALSGGDEGLNDDHVIAEEPDARGEVFLLTHGEQLVSASLATADPSGVAMVHKAIVGSPAHEVDRIVDDVAQAKPFFLVGVFGVAVDEGDIDLALSQHP